MTEHDDGIKPGETGQREETEIEVTPEMIEAGALALAGYNHIEETVGSNLSPKILVPKFVIGQTLEIRQDMAHNQRRSGGPGTRGQDAMNIGPMLLETRVKLKDGRLFSYLTDSRAAARMIEECAWTTGPMDGAGWALSFTREVEYAVTRGVNEWETLEDTK